jgi:multiple antibiotic resistance protein
MDHLFWKHFAIAFTSLFVAMDIIGVLPMYIAMTRGRTVNERKKIINTSMIVAFVVAVIFALAGREIFRYLGIGISDFRIAGGLVLLLVSLADLVGGPTAVRSGSGSTGIVPLAVPLITGPGVLTQLVLQIGTLGYPVTLLALVVNFILAWGLLRKSHAVTRMIGEDGTVVSSKIAALLLAAIAVAMMRSGFYEAIREFQR